MAVVIRMKRAGAKKRPFYRVVVANSRSPRDGRYIEQLGYYDPLTDPATFQIDAARYSEWIRRGALPSESVGVMVSKHVPAELRAPARVAEPAAAKPKKVAPAKSKSKSAKPKSKPRRKAATKGSAKKAMTRAKAKAKKASGAAKPKAASKKAKN